MIEWRPVPGFPNYEASSIGLVRRVINGRTRKARFVLSGGIGSNGYIRYTVYNEHSKKQIMSAHRLVALAFLGPPPSQKHEVAHNDGSKLNNAAINLRWATRSENAKDTLAHGTAILGEQHHASKFTADLVVKIRNLHKNGRSAKSLARELSVHSTTIDAIVKRQTWAHVK